MRMKKGRYLVWLLIALCAAAFRPERILAQESMSLSTIPSNILIGTQFDGTRLEVSGTAPAGSEVILRFTGAPSALHLREKGKVFGLLWMNVGQIAVNNVPKVCIVDCSTAFSELGPEASSYTLAGLMKQVEVEKGSDDINGIDIEKELLLLKSNEHLYQEFEKGVVLGPDEGDVRNFSAVLPIPSALSPGSYQVEAVAIRDGKVIARASSEISAKMVGFPEWLSRLAFDRSLVYGLMATIIALVSGLLIGMVFQSKGAH